MKLIDKSVLVAEIEKLKEENKPNSKSISEYIKGGVYGFDLAIEKTLSILDTLEVKEVDLEKEYKDFVEEDPVYNKLVNGIVGKAIAKHFFELALSLKNS